MTPDDNPPAPSSARPRVWLVASINPTPDPDDHPTVRDNRMRTWQPGTDGHYHSTDGWHHTTWTELHTHFDLVEISTRIAA
jgi:hypothetical protein